MGLFVSKEQKEAKREAKLERIKARQDAKTARQGMRSDAAIKTGGKAGFGGDDIAAGLSAASPLIGAAGAALGLPIGALGGAAGAGLGAPPEAAAAAEAEKDSPAKEEKPSLSEMVTDNPGKAAAVAVVGLGGAGLIAKRLGWL
jgi:hypothetical protein